MRVVVSTLIAMIVVCRAVTLNVASRASIHGRNRAFVRAVTKVVARNFRGQRE